MHTITITDKQLQYLYQLLGNQKFNHVAELISSINIQMAKAREVTNGTT